MMVETYLRRGQRSLQRAALSPAVRRTAAVAACTGSGFLLSAVGLREIPQPVAMGLICGSAGWQAALMMMGAMLGYPTFWGSAGCMGIVWSAAAGVLTLMINSREDSRDQPLMLPVAAAFLAAVTGAGFRLILGEPVSWLQLPVQAAAACFSGILFIQAARCRDPVTDWLILGLALLALGRIALPLAYGTAAALAVAAPFPAAALAGVALDLGARGAVPMTAALCIAWFLRLMPLDRKWKRCLMPLSAYLLLSLGLDVWAPQPLPWLLSGGALGLLLPAGARLHQRRGPTGAAQVRLEQGAELLLSLGKSLQEIHGPPIDRQALLDQAHRRACGGCSHRKKCPQQASFSLALLEDPLEADCPRQGRLVPELHRARAHLRMLQSDRKRRWEYRAALEQQYQFLGSYLRHLADLLPRAAVRPAALFRAETAVCSRGREEANGDLCYRFSGPECRYFLLLCDGMGTGPEAAREAREAGNLLRQMLASGFPAEHALRSMNSLLTLGDRAGAVTLDLAEVFLDTGIVRLYKWGAAPSWVLTRRGTERIGTATPPPGIAADAVPMTVKKLSLRRGEILVLVSDGVDGEQMPSPAERDPEGPPEVLAAAILEKAAAGTQDDATVAILRLRPTGPPLS